MTQPALSLRHCSGAELREANRSFYEGMWNDAHLVAPERFNTWPLVSSLLAGANRRLEIAPGLRPRLPLSGTHFVDTSGPAVERLQGAGGLAVRGPVTALPYPDASFDLLCALDIIEHVEEDALAVAELARVCAEGGQLLISVPLYNASWTAFDDFVGHRRRYEPYQIQAILTGHGFVIEQSAIFGMQPGSSWLVDLGMWFLIHRRRRAMWFYNRLFMPLGVRFQKPLRLTPGFAVAAAAGVDEVFLVCRKKAPAQNSTVGIPGDVP